MIDRISVQRHCFLMCSAASVALLSATTAKAVDAPPAAVSEVVVTGSRIPSPNLRSVSPITAISSQDLKLEGNNDTVDALNQLPQVNIGVTGLNNTPNPLSSSGGFTTVNLRNLGTVRTLVLIDGKRLLPGDPTLGGEAPDLDNIPGQLIDRVEVVTGGASAVYGSDAVAGVVNFVMKHNFEGVQVDLQYGENQHNNGNQTLQGLERNAKGIGAVAIPSGSIWDGKTVNVSAIVGSNSPDGKGNVTAYMAYRHQDPVSQSARDFSACQLNVSQSKPFCAGSSNSNYFSGDSGVVYSVFGSAPNNVFLRRGSAPTTPPASFNSQPYEYLSRADERYQFGFLSKYQIARWANAYADFSFLDDRSHFNIAPSALFRQTYAVNCNNPFLSAQQAAIMCAASGLGPTDNAQLTIGRRDIEGGPRIYDYGHLGYRAVVGLRGDIGDAWHYDVYGQYGFTKFLYSVQNDLSISRIRNGLQVVNVNGTPTCLSVVNGSDANCVPYNIFADGGVTPAAINYIKAFGSQQGDTQEQIVSANVTGQLAKYGIRSPFASDGVGINFGAEYRREQLHLRADEEFASGDLSGAGQAAHAVSGAFDVKELFGEVRVPIAQDLPAIKDLSAEAGYRFSHYSLAGDTSAYKFGLEYAPVADARLRASFQRAVRSPDIQELFAPPNVGNGVQNPADPCAPNGGGGNEPATATLAQCMNTGVTAAQYGDGRDPQVGGTDKIPQCASSQCGSLTGGSIGLKPEQSDTYSFGAVVTPRFLPGSNLSVDYFDITVKNAISTIPENVTLNNCLTSRQFCNLVVRNAGTGALFNGTNQIADGGYVSGVNVNVATLKTTGVDFAANYRFGLREKGAIALSFNGTWTRQFVNEPVPGGGTYDCAGLFGPVCGFQPRWKHTLRVTYTSPWNVKISGQWRYTSSLALETNSSNPLLSNGQIDTYDKLSNRSYFDLTANWAVKTGIVVRAGVNNVFDKDPPVVAQATVGSGAPNAFPTYDLLGRQLFVGLTADF